jgi:hypothetical protein
MNWRVLMLSALLVSPAWSQEPETSSSVAAARSFDLRSDAVRKIVHATASSQSVPVQVSQGAPAKRESSPEIEYVPPEKPAVVKEIAPTPVAAPESDGFLSAVFDIAFETLVDSLLGDETDEAMQKQYDTWRACQARDANCRLPPPPPQDD